MLQLVSKFICFLIMYATGYLVIKKIVGKSPKITATTYMYIMLLALATVFLHKDKYTTIYSIIIFLLNIVVYKKVFKLDLSQATIVCSILMLLLTISDIFVTSILRLFFSQLVIRTNYILSIVANLSIGIVSVIINENKLIQSKLQKFYQNIKIKKLHISIVYLVILIIGLIYLLYNYSNINGINEESISNIIILFAFAVVTNIYIDSKNDYKVLSDEYDVLFNYVQNFEDWIEKEQLNRHEYKNQLAVLRTVAKDKKVKSKIDEILDDNINIEDEVVNKLKDLPKGGIKGLMYYKAAIAKKKKINLVVDVSLKSNSKLKKLDESQMKIICKLIGIYFDNAIEASFETRNK